MLGRLTSTGKADRVGTLGVAIIGTGGISLQNHLPGLALSPDAKVVALCDADPAVLDRAARHVPGAATTARWEEAVARDDVAAVVIATPNFLHAPIALASIRAGKHIFCEKPLAMSLAEALDMLRAAREENVRHMTAFTYRFVPAMRYLHHLVRRGDVGQPWHFRAQRFQDWGDRDLGWRQEKRLAGTGEIGDMLSHRIDFGHHLVGRMTRIAARHRRFLDDRRGHASDLDDWVSLLADFDGGATGVLESTKLATGWGEGPRSRDYCEVNGPDGTLVYQVSQPLEVLVGRKGHSGLEPVAVPDEFLKPPGSPRDPKAGDPLITFRYDQSFEFIAAIREGRDCRPNFADGAQVQAVTDAILLADRDGRWISIPHIG